MGYPRTCFSLTIGRILDGVSETAHVPLDRVVVMVPENGECMTRPTQNREGSELVGNGDLPRWNGRNDLQNRTFTWM